LVIFGRREQGGLAQTIGAHAIIFLLDRVKGRIKRTPTATVGFDSLALENLATPAAGFWGGFVLKSHESNCTLKTLFTHSPSMRFAYSG
jgi:hypothetical protein